ncbi:MAG: class I SAM-dependent methyltransferase [Bacteroidota bacterium]
MEPSLEKPLNSLIPVSSTHKNFELLYLEYRKKIHQIYSDAQVKELPRAFTFNLQKEEWKDRAIMVGKFLKYLKKNSHVKQILEVGCGNGWLCHNISNAYQRSVIGLDLSLIDIEQAQRVFKQSNLNFVHGDIFEDVLPMRSFDLIVLNNTIHQFPNLRQLIERCQLYLKSSGELHIMGSPIYKWQKLEQERQQTLSHYESLNLSQMMQFHFHHSWDDFYPFKFRKLYTPKNILPIISHALPLRSSLHPWVRIKNEP